VLGRGPGQREVAVLYEAENGPNGGHSLSSLGRLYNLNGC
jgi:hypothetical protein